MGADTGTQSPTSTNTDVPSYQERLGDYAAFVLRGGEVPLGSIEHLTFLETCVADAGFEVEVVPEEGALLAAPGQQEDEYRQALALCEEEAFSSGLVGRPTTPGVAELQAWYEAYQLTYACLIEEGFEPDPPPSVELYVEGGGSTWHPYNGLSPKEAAEVEETCTQDLLVLFEQLGN